MIKTGLVWGLRFVHILLVAFIVFGWAFPHQPIRWVHLCFVPLLIAHWQMNKGQCILTQWEKRLLGESEEVQGDFTRQLLKLIRVELSLKQLHIFIYSLMGLSWLGSLSFIIF